MKEFVITIPYVLPSANEQQRMHWSGRARIKERCGEFLIVARAELKGGGKPIHTYWPVKLLRFTLHIERHAPRGFDADNLVSAHKQLVDAMKVKGGIGMIVDDSPHHMVSCTASQVQCKHADRHTVIRLTEVK